MKRTPLRRKSPMRRRSRMSHGRGTAYSRRDRSFEFMGWVRTQSCVVSKIGVAGVVDAAPLLGLPCSGPVQADHAGERIAGMSTKSRDRDCITMCLRHHEDRTNNDGIFADMTKEQRREWRRAAIDYTHELARSHGVTVPDC